MLEIVGIGEAVPAGAVGWKKVFAVERDDVAVRLKQKIDDIRLVDVIGCPVPLVECFFARGLLLPGAERWIVGGFAMGGVHGFAVGAQLIGDEPRRGFVPLEVFEIGMAVHLVDAFEIANDADEDAAAGVRIDAGIHHTLTGDRLTELVAPQLRPSEVRNGGNAGSAGAGGRRADSPTGAEADHVGTARAGARVARFAAAAGRQDQDHAKRQSGPHDCRTRLNSSCHQGSPSKGTIVEHVGGTFHALVLMSRLRRSFASALLRQFLAAIGSDRRNFAWESGLAKRRQSPIEEWRSRVSSN
ncbi:MAG TPA: hypothetical protein VF881_05965 [Polyangiaceae bacterium]